MKQKPFSRVGKAIRQLMPAINTKEILSKHYSVVSTRKNEVDENFAKFTDVDTLRLFLHKSIFSIESWETTIKFAQVAFPLFTACFTFVLNNIHQLGHVNLIAPLLGVFAGISLCVLFFGSYRKGTSAVFKEAIEHRLKELEKHAAR
ncbi:hypothetical protein [Alicyclobacillus fodiniaquatilis]|uniref:Holin-X, holin superfamily III n=1 Tax=Alicyclobacillus fodiniaquatilis TaxID=1661150 RepID=A0ABW4JI56_9BACL